MNVQHYDEAAPSNKSKLENICEISERNLSAACALDGKLKNLIEGLDGIKPVADQAPLPGGRIGEIQSPLIETLLRSNNQTSEIFESIARRIDELNRLVGKY